MKKILSLVIAIAVIFTTICGGTINAEAKENPMENTSETSLETSIRSKLYRMFPDDVLVENIKIESFTKEYLENLEFNSKENKYFGQYLSDLNLKYKGKPYIFTYDEKTNNSKTILLEKYDDNKERIIRNLSKGGGILLVTAVLTYATGGTSVISFLACNSLNAEIACGLNTALAGGVIEFAKEYVHNKDIKKSFEKGIEGASEGFKDGCILGVIAGTVSGGLRVKGMAKNGLKIKDINRIMKDEKIPENVIKEIHTMDEYGVYANEKYQSMELAGRKVLVPDFGKSSKSKNLLKSNIERMTEGYAPVNPETGNIYELHHIGQENGGTLIMLDSKLHKSVELHSFKKASEIERNEFNTVRKNIYMELSKKVS